MSNIWTMFKFTLSHLCLLAFAFADNRPNIVIMLADDMGYNDIGFLGSDIYTPELNRLANESIRLNNHYVQFLCSPSRAALLTGRYPVRISLDISKVTFPFHIIIIVSKGYIFIT